MAVVTEVFISYVMFQIRDVRMTIKKVVAPSYGQLALNEV